MLPDPGPLGVMIGSDLSLGGEDEGLLASLDLGEGDVVAIVLERERGGEERNESNKEKLRDKNS